MVLAGIKPSVSHYIFWYPSNIQKMRAFRSLMICNPEEKEVHWANNATVVCSRSKWSDLDSSELSPKKKKAHPGELVQLSHHHWISQLSNLGEEGKGGLQKHAHSMSIYSEAKVKLKKKQLVISHVVLIRFSLFCCVRRWQSPWWIRKALNRI